MPKTHITRADLKAAEPLILDVLEANGCKDTKYIDAWLWFPEDDYPLHVNIKGAQRIANLYVSKEVGGVQSLCTIRISSAGGYEVVKNSEYPFMQLEPGILVWLDLCKGVAPANVAPANVADSSCDFHPITY